MTFEDMYNNLTKVIRAKASSDDVEGEIQKLVSAYPDKKSQLLARLDSAFGAKGNYKTARAAFELGATYYVQELGSPEESEIHPDMKGWLPRSSGSEDHQH